MANCEVCGKSFGFLEGRLLENKAGSYTLNTLMVCNSCNTLLDKVKQGELKSYLKIHEILDNTHNEKLASFLPLWETISPEIKAKQKEAEAAREAAREKARAVREAEAAKAEEKSEDK